MDPETAGFETAVDEQERTGEAEREGERETGRLEAFSDGVFAIAITLLILTIQVPITTKRSDLGNQLVLHWSSYLAYLISFAFILIMWVNHHNLFRLIHRTDQTFLLLNGLLLLFVTVVPFPTALVADYLQSSLASSPRDTNGVVALAVFNGTYVMIGVAFNLVWHYASHRGRLLSRRAEPASIAEVHRRFRYGPLYLICFVVGLLTFLSPWNLILGLGLNVALAAFWALPGRVPPRLRPASALDDSRPPS